MPWVAKLIDKDGVERYVNDQHEEGVVDRVELASEYETEEAAAMAGAAAFIADDRSIVVIEANSEDLIGSVWRSKANGAEVIVFRPPPGQELTEGQLLRLYRKLTKDR